MVKVYNKATNEFLGRISEEELKFLADHLEEEGLDDRDYFLREETLQSMREAGAPAHLLEVIEGGRKGLSSIEIRWENEKAPRS